MSTTKINGGTQIQSATITDTQIAAGAAIASSKLADGANFTKKDGSVAFTGDQSMGSHKLTNVTDPTSAQDAATKNYVDTVAQGLSPKPTARVATTAALAANTYANGTSGVGATLTANANGAIAAVDGVTLAANDVVLVKNEATASHNGLYVLTQVGDASHPYILTRHVDMDSAAEFSGAFVPVDNEGTTNANTLWLAGYSSAFTVGTTSVTFVQLNAATSYTGSNGINISGNVISPTYGSAANTITQGNDSRLSDARTPVGTALTGGQLYVGNGSNVAAAVALSGDVSSVSNSGSVTLNAANIVKTANVIKRETPSGTINGSNTSFTIANTPVAGTEEVYLNGILQDAGAGNDYTISGATITMLSAPLTGDKLRVSYLK